MVVGKRGGGQKGLSRHVGVKTTNCFIMLGTDKGRAHTHTHTHTRTLKDKSKMEMDTDTHTEAFLGVVSVGEMEF